LSSAIHQRFINKVSQPWPVALVSAALLIAIFAVMLWRFRGELRADMHQQMIGRDAAFLYPLALQQLAERAAANGAAVSERDNLVAVLSTARQQGVLGMALFDSEGNLIEAVPGSQLFAELPVEDYLQLLLGTSISRYHESFTLERYFPGVAVTHPRTPVLEVLLALPSHRAESRVIGFVRYYIDGRALGRELSTIDERIGRQTYRSLATGSALIVIIVAAACLWLLKSQRTIAERNAELARTNFELTLAAKASAVGQITSHLIHGLQGPVAGLQSLVQEQESKVPSEWSTVADYTARLQSIIAETVGLLGDVHAQTSFELSSEEIVERIRERNTEAAGRQGVSLKLSAGPPAVLDNHRGSLLSMIATNLVQNAIAITPAGGWVHVTLCCAGAEISLEVRDNGPGIAAEMLPRLFQPGQSNRSGGSGLGLAISRLLARQMGGDIRLVSTGTEGTRFRMTAPSAGSTGILAVS
jgi:signal transduction histidine kinase